MATTGAADDSAAGATGEESSAAAVVVAAAADASSQTKAAGGYTAAELPEAGQSEAAPSRQISRTAALLADQVKSSSGKDDEALAASASSPPAVPDVAQQGRWLYICVDRSGIQIRKECVYKAKGDGRINLGDLVQVCERVLKEGIVWLRLEDGRGWTFERKDRQRMGEVIDEEVAYEETSLLISPKLLDGLKMQIRPLALDFLKTWLHPGTPIAVQARCRVASQDGPLTFLNVIDDMNNQGWIPISVGGKATTAEYAIEQIADPGTTLWVSVCPDKQVAIYLAPGRSSTPINTAEKCELLEVAPIRSDAPEQLISEGLSFYRLTVGGWFCETNASGTVPFVWVKRVPHWWIYSVASRDGSVVRQLPTRDNRLNTKITIKRGVEVRSSEKVTFPSGDEFIRLDEPNKGWVPLLRQNGEPKMIAEREVPPGDAPIEAMLTAAAPTGDSKLSSGAARGFKGLKSTATRALFGGSHKLVGSQKASAKE